MSKLVGLKYIDFWQRRMALGPDQASFNGVNADRQGETIWSFISDSLADSSPKSVLDFGCGYGRMLRRMHGIWPAATFYGVDLCQAALDSIALDRNWFDCGKPKLSKQMPDDIRVDLIFSCLALQHVTDDLIMGKIMRAMRKMLNPGGHIVLFENVSSPGANHVRDMDAAHYMDLWPDLQWKNRGTIELGQQEHALLIGQKQ